MYYKYVDNKKELADNGTENASGAKGEFGRGARAGSDYPQFWSTNNRYNI